MQQAEFVRPQVQWLSRPARLQGCKIDQQRAQFQPFVDPRLPDTALQRHDPVQDRCAIDRADQIIVRPGSQSAAFVVCIILFEHDGDMRFVETRVSAQTATHLQTRKVFHHPVDESTHRPFDQPSRAIGIQTGESIAHLAILEIGELPYNRIGQENIDRAHAVFIPPCRGCDGALM